MLITLPLPWILATGFSAPMQAAAPQEHGVFGALQESKEWTMPKDPAVIKKLEEWQDQKVGLLIHWGLYSQWGITESWSLATTHFGWNPRPAPYDKLSDRDYVKAYEHLQTTFNPTKFDPNKWAVAFKEGGVKYVLSMTKHHDGFCMWDTKETDYKITSALCPFHTDKRADVVKEACDAFRRHGIVSGLYFSKADWHSPYYWLPELGPGAGQGPNYTPADKPDRWAKFKDFTWAQIKELMTEYGPQQVLWLDGGAVRPPEAGIDMNGMAAMARTYQPGLIVTDRTVAGENENYITPEGQIPTHHLDYPWETCMPMGTAWPWVPNDHFKSVGTLVRNLCHIVARGGNYLIGIGPDANGEFDPGVYDRLKGLGAWLKLNGEAIYGTRSVAPYEAGDVMFTQKRDGAIYAIVLAADEGAGLPDRVTLPKEIADKVMTAKMVGFGKLDINDMGVLMIPEGYREKSAGGHGWAIRLGMKG